MHSTKRPMEKLKKEQWQEQVLDEMDKKAKTIKPYKRPVGIGFDIVNIEFVNKIRGVLSFSEYINGVVTALREFHEEKKNG